MAVIDNLRISKEAMETAIQKFETRKMGLENAYLKISNEVRTLDGTYHGKASEIFKSQFDSLYNNLKQNEAVLANVIANLKSALNVYEDAERSATSLAESADVGVAYQSNL